MLFLPKIGQGTGYDLYKNKINKKKISYILDKGIELGLNLIDTAENYNMGEAEKIIGDVIRKRREKVIISTKFSPENSVYKRVIQSCEKSLKRLKTDYIDIYQFHWPNPKVPLEETLNALVFLKKAGKIKEFGAGNFSFQQLHKAKSLLKKEKFFSLQTEFNIFERAIEQNGIFNFCRKSRIRIIAYSPLDQGHIASVSQKQKKLLLRISGKYKKSVAQIILAWILSKKIITPIPMTLNLNHLTENAKAAELVLNDVDVRKIDKTFYSKLEFIPVDQIRILPVGERNSKAYQTIEAALENTFGFTPSPKDVSEEIQTGGFLKPVRLIRSHWPTNRYKYNLISGRIRYWAWVIAYGKNKPIPAYIRDHLKIG